MPPDDNTYLLTLELRLRVMSNVVLFGFYGPGGGPPYGGSWVVSGKYLSIWTFLSLIKHHKLNTYEEVRLQLNASSNSALNKQQLFSYTLWSLYSPGTTLGVHRAENCSFRGAGVSAMKNRTLVTACNTIPVVLASIYTAYLNPLQDKHLFNTISTLI
jgi:hypothetical protein